MELRDKLKVPNIEKERLKKLVEIAEELEGSGNENLLEIFNKEIGKALTREDLHFSGSMSAETFVRIQLNPKAEKMAISYEEYLEIITKICTATSTEWERDYWLKLLSVNLNERNLSDLIYWPKEYFRAKGLSYSDEMSPKEILDYLLSKEPDKPIFLPQTLN